MSERVLRPVSMKSVSSTSSTSSQNNQKRKSTDGDCEDTENISPNLSTKKLRSKTADENCSAAASDQPVKSALPRYQRAQGAQPKASTGNTPGKSKLRLPGTPQTASKRHGRRSSMTPRAVIRICNDKIGSYFDDAFTVNEQKITDIMASLKVKGKKAPFVDFKEKAKKYETVIKELREALRTVLTEIPSLREKAISHEALITGMISEMDADLQENHGQREALKANQRLLNEELAVISNELKSSAGLAESLQREHSPLRNRSQEVESQYAKIQLKYSEEVSKHMASDMMVTQLQAELYEVRQSKENAEELHKAVRFCCRENLCFNM